MQYFRSASLTKPISPLLSKTSLCYAYGIERHATELKENKVTVNFTQF